MVSRVEHYLLAEQIEAEGRDAVKRLAAVAEGRASFVKLVQDAGGPHPLKTAEYNQQFMDYTQAMDELGKKAMGCWAQAQIHATLAAAPPDVERGALRKKKMVDDAVRKTRKIFTPPTEESTDDERDVQPQPPAGDGEPGTGEPREGGQGSSEGD